MAERREIYGERIISPELNLRQQGIGADLVDAWGESLPAYGIRWADSLLDPTPDYIDPDYLSGGWEAFVQSPDDRNLFRVLNNAEQAEKLRSDLDARILRQKGQSYDGAIYNFAISLVPELLNPVNYIGGAAFTVGRRAATTLASTATANLRVAGLTSAVEVGALSQFAPYIENEELVSMFFASTIAGGAIGTGLSAAARGIARGVDVASPAAQELGGWLRNAATPRQYADSIIDYEGSEVFRGVGDTVDVNVYPINSTVRESTSTGQRVGWVYIDAIGQWLKSSADSYALRLHRQFPLDFNSDAAKNIDIVDASGASVGKLLFDAPTPQGNKVVSEYELSDVLRLTDQQILNSRIEKIDDNSAKLTYTVDGEPKSFTIRKTRKAEGEAQVGKIDNVFVDAPKTLDQVNVDRIAALREVPSDIGLADNGRSLINFLIEKQRALELDEVKALPVNEREARAVAIAKDRVIASKESRDYLRNNLISSLAVVFQPISRLPKAVRNDNYYMNVLMKLVGQFESMSAAAEAGIETGPSVLMKRERHIGKIGPLMQKRSALYRQYTTGREAQIGSLSSSAVNAAANAATAARQFFGGTRPLELTEEEFGRAALEVYAGNLTQDVPHPIYGTLPDEVFELAAELKPLFDGMEIELRESGAIKSTGDLQRQIAQLRREISFEEDRPSTSPFVGVEDKVAEVTRLEAELAAAKERPINPAEFFGNRYLPHNYRKDVIENNYDEFHALVRDDHFMAFMEMSEPEADEAAHQFLRAWLSDPDISVDPSSLLPSVSATYGRGLNLDTKKLLAVNANRQVSFIEDDMSSVMLTYFQKTGTQIEMRRTFGSNDATNVIEDVRKHLKDKGLSEKEVLEAESVLLLMRDRLMGAQHSLPSDHWARNARRTAGNWVNTAVLGAGILSQFVDGAQLVARVGGKDVAKYLTEYVTGNMPRIANEADKSQIAEIFQWEMSTAMNAFSEGDKTNMSRMSRISGWSERMTDKFFKANLMTPFNQVMKRTAIRFSNHQILKDAHSNTKAARGRLARLGFSPRDIEQLRKQDHTVSLNGVYYPNTDNWTDSDGIRLKQKVFNAAYAEATNMIVTPGPLNRWQVSEGVLASTSKLARERAKLQEAIDREDATRELLNQTLREQRRDGTFNEPASESIRNGLREGLKEASAKRAQIHQGLGKNSRTQNAATLLLSMSTMLLTFPITSMAKITHAMASGASPYPVQGVAAFMVMGFLADYLKTPGYAWEEKEPEEHLIRSIELSGLLGMFEQVHGIFDKAGFGARSSLGLDIPFTESGEEGAEIAQDVAGVGWSLAYGLVDTLTDGSSTTYEQARAIQRVVPGAGLIWWRDGLKDITWALTGEE